MGGTGAVVTGSRGGGGDDDDEQEEMPVMVEVRVGGVVGVGGAEDEQLVLLLGKEGGTGAAAEAAKVRCRAFKAFFSCRSSLFDFFLAGVAPVSPSSTPTTCVREALSWTAEGTPWSGSSRRRTLA